MNITFDPKYNIAYIMFKEKAAQVISVKVSEDLILDLSPDGSIYGIELLNAEEQLQHQLSFINKVTGKSETVNI